MWSTNQDVKETKKMLEHIQTISVSVTNQDQALDFYVNKLGLEKRADEAMGPDERWLVVAPSGSQTGIMLAKADASGDGLPLGRFTGYIFYSANIEDTCAELESGE